MNRVEQALELNIEGNDPVAWTDEAVQAFEGLKKLLPKLQL